MRDLAIRLEHRPGALAEMGEALGRAGVSVEGGGAWVIAGQVIARAAPLLDVQPVQSAQASPASAVQTGLRVGLDARTP